MAVVTLEKLSKRFDRASENAVHEVSLEIAHGELMVFLGPSGCGKTTTLRMIAGLESITSGTLAIERRPVNHIPAKDRNIAMVFQSYALYPHMSVRGNLGFGLRRRSVDRAEIARRVTEVAATLGLSELLDRRPHALSGGQRQRVALGRAIVRDPAVFLFDEPLSNLDAALRASTRQELARLHDRLGATMIYVTHDQVEAMTLGDRICLMDRGRVAQVGAPMEVYHRPANLFVARFLGAPPMNILEAALGSDGIGPVASVGGAAVRLASLLRPAASLRRILIGFRPEKARFVNAPSADTLALRGELKLVERLGAETVGTVSVTSGTEILVRTPGDARLTAGGTVLVAVPHDDLYVFDADTGQTIGSSAVHTQTETNAA